MSTSSLDKYNLTVHNFSHGRASTSLSVSQALILEHGQKLLNQTIDETRRWHSHPCTRPQSEQKQSSMYHKILYSCESLTGSQRSSYMRQSLHI